MGKCVCARPAVNTPVNPVRPMGRKLWDIFKSLRRPKQIRNKLTNGRTTVSTAMKFERVKSLANVSGRNAFVTSSCRL